MDKKEQDSQKRPKGSRSKPAHMVPIMGVELESVLRNLNVPPISNASEYFRLLRASPQYASYDDLILASLAGDHQRVKTLLRHGVNVNKLSERGTTALIESLSHRRFEIAELLIGHGADVHAISSTGWTALHLAASLGSEKLVFEILSRAANINLQTQEGLTPLMLAALRRYPNIVKVLLKSGADVNCADNSGRTALMHAATGDIDESGGDFGCVEALIAGGAFANARDNQGWTALMGASFYGDVQSVRLLLANSAEVNGRDHQGRTPLTLAKERKHEIVVQAIKAAGGRS
jgi:ankyrin repeat protein